MEKETSISDHLIQIWQDNTDTIPAFQEIADYLHNVYQFNVQFCEIYGKRWSNVASSPGFVISAYRKELSKRWGVIYEQEILHEIWDALIPLI